MTSICSPEVSAAANSATYFAESNWVQSTDQPVFFVQRPKARLKSLPLLMTCALNTLSVPPDALSGAAYTFRVKSAEPGTADANPAAAPTAADLRRKSRRETSVFIPL